MKTSRGERRARTGALRPRYSFVLNPYVEARFTRCPKCNARTRLRKLPLVIHVEDCGLVLLGKTCRLCLGCDMLIAHEAEIEQVLSAWLGHPVDGDTLVVLGTVERPVWRRGFAHPVSLDAVQKHMADFKRYMCVASTLEGWYPKEDAG